MKSLIALALLATTAPAIAQTAPPMEARTSAATYVRMAASTDNYERESSQMVLTSARNPDVRRFAQMMIADHGMASAQMTVAAKEASIGAGSGTQPQQAAMLSALRSVPDDKRERAYVDQQVIAHQEALALHQGFAAQGDNPGLKAVAEATVPVIQAHLTEIQRIQAAMGGPMTK